MAKTIPQLTDATTVNAADELIVQQGGITKRATGAELAKGLNAINGTVSVKDFGAVGDGVTNDAAALQACFDFCATNNLPFRIPTGDFYVGTSSLTIYTSGRCEGRIMATNSGSDPVVEVSSLSADVEEPSTSSVSSWGNLSIGQTYIGSATDLKDWYVFLQTSDPWIVRTTPGGTFNKYHAMRFTTDDGFFTPEVRVDITNANITSVVKKRIRETLTIAGLTIVFSDGSGERIGAALISRPNTTLNSCFVINNTATPVQQGFYTLKTCMVSINDCFVSGLSVNSTNYGYAAGGWSFDVSLHSCRESKSRRGLDIQNGFDVSVVSGSFPSGIGAHWGHGLSVTGGTVIGANNTINPSPVLYSGSDLNVSGCRIVARASNTLALVRMRPDLPELAGSVCLLNNSYIVDDLANVASDIRLFSISYGSATGYNPGRRLIMPSNVIIEGGKFTLLKSGSTTSSFIAWAMHSQWTNNSATCTHGAVYNMNVSIGNIKTDFGALGDIDTSTNVPRLGVVYNKGFDHFGSGAVINIHDTAGAYVFASAISDNVDTSEKRETGRADFYFARIPVVFASVADGVYRRCIAQDVGTYTRNKPSGTSAFSVVGDEEALGPSLGELNLRVYAKTALPSHRAGRVIYVNNDVGGAVMAFSDGTDWRRVTDRAVIA
jgi:hypothetical protein